MIEDMNPCTNLVDGEPCGGQDIAFSNKIEGEIGAEIMTVIITCRCCGHEKEYPVNIFDGVKDHVQALKCISLTAPKTFCEATTLLVQGIAGRVVRGVPGEDIMTVTTECSTCHKTKDYTVNIRDVINPLAVAPHNTANPVT